MPAFSPAEAARLRGLACRGTFEAHLTVDVETAEARAAFADLCDAAGVKCVLIELARGAHRSQPMTSSHHHGELADVIAEVEALHARVVAAGFAVVRVKLEADATNAGLPAGGYFEFHAKLAPPAADLVALAALCSAAGAHLSRNAREPDGTRFVTLRVHADRERAGVAFAALVDALARAGHAIASTKAEYAIHDGRIELDAGWLESR